MGAMYVEKSFRAQTTWLSIARPMRSAASVRRNAKEERPVGGYLRGHQRQRTAILLVTRLWDLTRPTCLSIPPMTDSMTCTCLGQRTTRTRHFTPIKTKASAYRPRPLTRRLCRRQSSLRSLLRSTSSGLRRLPVRRRGTRLTLRSLCHTNRLLPKNLYGILLRYSSSQHRTTRSSIRTIWGPAMTCYAIQMGWYCRRESLTKGCNILCRVLCPSSNLELIDIETARE